MKYQRKRVSVEAIQFVNSNHYALMKWIGERDPKGPLGWRIFQSEIVLDGQLQLKEGEWLVFEDLKFRTMSGSEFTKLFEIQEEPAIPACHTCGQEMKKSTLKRG